MKTYRVIYLPTGRLVGTVEASSERMAKLRATKKFGYMNWQLHHVYCD